VGRLGFRVGVSASYRYIASFGNLIHKLRHTSFGIVDLRTSGPESLFRPPTVVHRALLPVRLFVCPGRVCKSVIMFLRHNTVEWQQKRAKPKLNRAYIKINVKGKGV